MKKSVKEICSASIILFLMKEYSFPTFLDEYCNEDVVFRKRP
ncbi:MAG: hypothetical protein SPE53_06565 [Prevotella sp.]|nr:hypothetical protein [Prevotella sp.]